VSGTNFLLFLLAALIIAAIPGPASFMWRQRTL
jgi:threonine/homoserine/homoserine lactone efflux protein